MLVGSGERPLWCVCAVYVEDVDDVVVVVVVVVVVDVVTPPCYLPSTDVHEVHRKAELNGGVEMRSKKYDLEC